MDGLQAKAATEPPAIRGKEERERTDPLYGHVRHVDPEHRRRRGREREDAAVREGKGGG